jgi:hypothetical protein
VNIPLEIKKLLSEKRKARAKWQRSHTPSDKTAFNRLSSILKSKMKAMRTNSFTNYVFTLSRYDNSIWKPIKSSCKPTLASPPLRLETLTQERWAKSNKEKQQHSRNTSRLYSNRMSRKLTKKFLNPWTRQHNQLNPSNLPHQRK